jgi:hypothetical protein
MPAEPAEKGCSKPHWLDTNGRCVDCRQVEPPEGAECPCECPEQDHVHCWRHGDSCCHCMCVVAPPVGSVGADQ